MAGICLCSTAWREGHPDLACLLSSMLESSPYRMKFQSIVPDFIFNSGGISVAFVLLIDWTDENLQRTFERSAKIKERFRNCHVILTVPSDEVNQSFLRSYFRYCLVCLGKPSFIPVHDAPMALERMLHLAHAHAEYKRQGIATMVDLERKQMVQSSWAYVNAVSSIPGINYHDANTLLQGIGSIDAISKSRKEDILEKTDLSAGKAEAIVKFFNDPTYYMTLKIG